MFIQKNLVSNSQYQILNSIAFTHQIHL